ncbi:MAG TPA: hypothetical protein ENI34_00810 [candidate division WOR-3 bacterium]|uniref:PpiC domain-containing protein n=1 Tax=candidate division WOR-3 bacterium TaxID=2052148 RepID=A0A9C9JZ93_UNCW3|nr:hypothetical protein [candidate division WOR-3 bacterium]
MKSTLKHLKYATLLLFVILAGLSCEDQVLFTVDGETYTIADFKENFQFTPTEDSLQRLKKIDEFINQMLAVHEARERGYDEDAIVKTAFETHKKDIIMRNYYETSVMSKVHVSESEIRDVYNKIIDHYHLAQIVVTSDSLAQYIESELEKGVLFDSLLKFSLDTLTENGDIGTFSVMSLPPQILEAVEKTPVGGTTKAVSFGEYFYILKVLEHKKADSPKYKDVKENIRNTLSRDKAMEIADEFIQKLIDDAKIEYNQEGLDALLKPDSLITKEDLKKWVVKKYDTAYVYVGSIREAIQNQYKKSFIEPQKLIERQLIPDLIYDKALTVNFDKKLEIKDKLRKALDFLMYQKFYSDEVLEKVQIDSMEVVNYYKTHKDDYQDKTLEEVFSVVKARVREAKIDTLRSKVFQSLRDKYNPVINQTVVAKLLKEE